MKSICFIDADDVVGPTGTVIAQKCLDIKGPFFDINEAGINAWNDQGSSKPPISDSELDGIVVDTGGRNFFLNYCRHGI